MADRRALIVGSWLAKGRKFPTSQKTISITKRWEKVFEDGKYGFCNLTDRNRLPLILHNPNLAQLIQQFEQAQDISDQTELLFYFLGHSVSFGEDDIKLILGSNKDGEDRLCSLKWLLKTLYDHAAIRNIVIILDTCHAGRTKDTFQLLRFNYYAMLASGDGYAFNANFSEGILRALEDSLRKNDQRIDRPAGGVTYQKIFEAASGHVIKHNGSNEQKPMCFGNYVGELLIEAPVVIPTEFNTFVSYRTVYGRVFRLLEIIRDANSINFDTLMREIRDDTIFLLQKDETNGNKYLSRKRLKEYIEFLIYAQWIVLIEGKYQITDLGRIACDRDRYNELLLEVIEQNIFPEEIDMRKIDEIVSALLTDMIPPTPIKMKERAAMKGLQLNLNPAMRVAIQVLPSTGRFLKGTADAIFPSEMGGS